MANHNPLRRQLSLVGLIIILGAFMWLAVQAVQLFPSAASTLASLANSVYNYNPREVRDFSVIGPVNMVNSGDVFTLDWPKLSVPGQYSFSYSCNIGVTANIRSASQAFTEANCDTNYNIGEVNQVEISIISSQARFAEVDYTISFFRTNATTPTAVASGGLTIINPSLSLNGEPIPTENAATSTESSATTTSSEQTENERPRPNPIATSTPSRATSTVSISTSTSSTPTSRATTTPERPAPTITYTYSIPTSRPDGFTDLNVSYLGVGSMNQSGTFINTGRVQALSVGAIQFSVHNLGTRTSDTWRYSAVLPNGQTYTSPDQEALKPNERATITLGFPAIGTETSLARFGVTVETSRDINATNNTFSWSTVIVR